MIWIDVKREPYRPVRRLDFIRVLIVLANASGFMLSCAPRT
jgi:hypothetical protein